MIATPASDPRTSSVYLSLVLGFAPTGMQKILSLVAQMEGLGKFAALNRNTDRAGLSFGIIQWAQKPGRRGSSAAMSAADKDQFDTIFGGGDPGCGRCLDRALPEAVRRSRIEVGADGESCLRSACRTVGITLSTGGADGALSAGAGAARAGCVYRVVQCIRRLAPDLKTERSAGFLLDVANQFGDGGLAKLYTAVHRPEMGEMDVLEAIADLTVERIDDALKRECARAAITS